MPSQEEKNKSMFNLLVMAAELLKEDDNKDKNFETAHNLVKQAFFKYLDLKDCPFRDACRESFEGENVFHEGPPYDWREDRD